MNRWGRESQKAYSKKQGVKGIFYRITCNKQDKNPVRNQWGKEGHLRDTSTKRIRNEKNSCCELLTNQHHLWHKRNRSWMAWAQFHRAAKHKNLLSIKCCSYIKTGLPTNFLLVTSCLLLVFSCCLLILKITWNFIGNPVFIEAKIFLLSKFLCSAALWCFNASRVSHNFVNTTSG